MILKAQFQTEWLGFSVEREWWLPRDLGFKSLTVNLGYLMLFCMWGKLKKGRTR